MRYVFDRDLEKNVEMLINGAKNILLRKKTRLQVLNEIGEIVTKSIKKFILSGHYKFSRPNHPITIGRKKHDYPLIQTGKIVSTLTYKIGKGNPKETKKTKIVQA